MEYGEKTPLNGPVNRDETITNDYEWPKLLESTIRPCLAEFVGTLLFVYTVCMAGCAPGDVWATFTVGFALFVLVASIGSVSGGHYNTAVTFGVLLSGGIKPLLALIYVIAQLLGAAVGAALVKVAISKSNYDNCTGGATVLGMEVTLGQGFLIEFMATTILVSVVLMTAVDSKGKSVLAPLAIGFSLSLNAMISAQLTGGSLNPARSFGPALVANEWTDHWLYWVAPLTASLVAALLYRGMFAAEDRRWGANRGNINNSPKPLYSS